MERHFWHIDKCRLGQRYLRSRIPRQEILDLLLVINLQHSFFFVNGFWIRLRLELHIALTKYLHFLESSNLRVFLGVMNFSISDLDAEALSESLSDGPLLRVVS